MGQAAQPDPFVEAAKDFHPSAPVTPDASDASEDWKLWQPQSGGNTPPGGLLDALKENWRSNTEPLPSDGTLGTAVHNIGGRAAKTFTAPFLHPMETIKGMVDIPTSGGISLIKSGIDRAREFGQDYSKDKPLAFENLAGDAAGTVLQGGLMSAGEAGINGARNFRPTPSPDIVPPTEMAARKLSQAVLPATKDASNFIKAAPLEVPNILESAKQAGNPLRTQLEFSKAAQSHANNIRDFYKNQILGPNDKMVKTSGTGFGRQQGEGPDTYASLSDIDKRITALNKQLDAPSLNADDARRALASKGDLEREAGGLRKILHDNLSQATGMTPEQVADVRQRAGRSYELANDTNAAVTGRMQAEGKTDLGPIHLSQIPSQLLERLRGGPTAIADRQFQRAIKNYPGEAQPLPEINPPQMAAPSTQRAPIWAGMSAEGHPNVAPQTPDIEGARAKLLTTLGSSGDGEAGRAAGDSR